MADAAIRRDFAKFAGGTPPPAQLLALADRLDAFDRPVLVVWADSDRLMPAEHGPRLRDLYPNARLEVLRGSSTLVGEDQPAEFARLVAEFARS